jgi:hypothetical protein
VNQRCKRKNCGVVVEQSKDYNYDSFLPSDTDLKALENIKS